MLSLLIRHFQWTEKTFGPGKRTKAITDHIRKELVEIEDAPEDLEEWVDVLLMAFDGARRTGASPAQILMAMERKHAVCKTRTYPYPVNEFHDPERDRGEP